jgi:hypothetical protein
MMRRMMKEDSLVKEKISEEVLTKGTRIFCGGQAGSPGGRRRS